uniref:60S ribosomal protein L10 n=1 Tax=Conus magus TaxID=6492 RepID=A0A5P8I145_CONMA|nr:60S ribosomal protein L10 [Conus magus]
MPSTCVSAYTLSTSSASTRCCPVLGLTGSRLVCVVPLESHRALWPGCTLGSPSCLCVPVSSMRLPSSKLCVVPSSSTQDARRSWCPRSGDSPSGHVRTMSACVLRAT